MEHSAVMNPDRAQEFARLFDSHQRLVFKVASTYTRVPSDIEDLAQEIAAQSWRAFPTYDAQRRFSTWLYRIALNVAISWLRSEGPRRRQSVAYDAQLHDPTFHDEPDADDGSRVLRGFIDSQGPLDRALLLLYLDERPLAEISEILGLTTTNLTTRIGRLKERLARYAENEHGIR
jgi:RNA polymerase sigma-70 factor (ECF subfamily)